jgi:hypothetical protein
MVPTSCLQYVFDWCARTRLVVSIGTRWTLRLPRCWSKQPVVAELPVALPHPLHAALAAPLIQQAVVAVLAIALPLALHVARAHAGDHGRLDPRQLLAVAFKITSGSFIIRTVFWAGIIRLGSTLPDSPARPGPDNSKINFIGQLTC